jgi:RNA polymerase sigma-70 factor (ECF subfamily)
MDPAPATDPSLLLRVRDARDQDAWRQFFELYVPLIYGYARKRGLQDADAADVAQDVFQRVLGALRRLDYDPTRGSFRSWLRTITRNRIASWKTGPQQRDLGSGDSTVRELLEEHPDGTADTLWDQHYQREVFLWAAEQARPAFAENTWLAFWRTAVEGQEAAAVAAGLGLSVGAVYVARSRVLDRIKKQVRQLPPD